MKITADRTPVNKDAAKVLSGKSVPANTIADGLDLIALNLTGDASRIKIAETLNKGMVAKYTVQIRKCINKPGCNVTMTFHESTPGYTVAHFTELT
jgi:hypothetical protein